MRWLGAMFRRDRETWTTLLGSDWASWPSKVLGEKTGTPPFITWQTGKDELKEIYRQAIEVADDDDFWRLDALFCEKTFHKRFH